MRHALIAEAGAQGRRRSTAPTALRTAVLSRRTWPMSVWISKSFPWPQVRSGILDWRQRATSGTKTPPEPHLTVENPRHPDVGALTWRPGIQLKKLLFSIRHRSSICRIPSATSHRMLRTQKNLLSCDMHVLCFHAQLAMYRDSFRDCSLNTAAVIPPLAVLRSAHSGYGG